MERNKDNHWGFKYIHAVTPNGPFIVSRGHPDIEAFLNNVPELERFDKNKRVYYLKPDSVDTIKRFKNQYEGKGAYILGKGPTLDSVKGFQNQDWPVFCCNDSIKKIKQLGIKNPLYCCQCDPDAGKIDYAPAQMIIRINCLDNYRDDNKIITASSTSLGTYHLNPCGAFTIAIARFLGCKEMALIAFDGAFGGELDYAKVIGYGPEKARFPDKKRFLLHGIELIEACNGVLGYRLNPTTLERTSFCIPPQ